MRDSNRIWYITNSIAYKWHDECPDLRFMQIMSNFIGWLGRDPFYMEDDEFLQKFNEFMEGPRITYCQ